MSGSDLSDEGDVSRRAVLGKLATAGAAAVGGAGATSVARAQSGATHTVNTLSKSGAKYFDPVGLYVEPGDTVKFVLESGRHSATSYTPDSTGYGGPRLIPKGAKPWNSGVLEEAGAAFTHTFRTRGTYLYYCIPHRSLGMVGKIVCGEPGGPGEKQSVPTADEPQGVMPPSDQIVKKKTLDWPYIPNESHGGPPLLFWASGLGFVGASAYLFSAYDRESGRYNEPPEGVPADRERDGE